MSKVYKIGIIGLVHDHIWIHSHLNDLKEIPDAKITCAADVNPPLLEKAKATIGLNANALYKDYRKLLEKEDVDACIVFIENSKHAEVTEACAEKGVHVMVEKPMAANLEQAERMVSAAEKSKIKLMINFPSMWNPSIRTCHDLVQEGKIGRVWMIRYRAGHKGPKEIGCSEYFYSWLYSEEKNGGGALLDFGCYGAHLLAWYLGRPTSVFAMKGTLVRDYLTVDDNAVIVTKHDKAMGNIEGTWSQTPGATWMSILGEEGTIVNSPVNAQEYSIYTAKTSKWEPIEPNSLPKEESNAMAFFVSHIRKDLSIDGPMDIKYARTSQEIVEAAKNSIKTGRQITL